uniref:Uncharacterized protein n=1 Tax=Ixodes ricinus TaxID=34613 RepID=A0A6B0UHQ4_IXORI
MAMEVYHKTSLSLCCTLVWHRVKGTNTRSKLREVPPLHKKLVPRHPFKGPKCLCLSLLAFHMQCINSFNFTMAFRCDSGTMLLRRLRLRHNAPS